jgi:hypothetical protein
VGPASEHGAAVVRAQAWAIGELDDRVRLPGQVALNPGYLIGLAPGKNLFID